MASRTLLEFAKEKFRDDWTPADETLFRATAEGRMASFGQGNPGDADKWGKDRILKANRIEWLCTQPEAIERVTHRGIQIRGVRIDDELGLSGVQVGFSLIIIHSALPGGIDLQVSHMHTLILSGTHTGSVCADQLSVSHGVFLRDGFCAAGQVQLRGATIGGNLDCEKGSFCCSNGAGLTADGVCVDGSVFMRQGFRANGLVRLVGARIGGVFDCSSGYFSNPEGTALAADGMSLQGEMSLNRGFHAVGEVRLNGASIGGDLRCERACFSNPGGRALSAERTIIGGHVILRDQIQFDGAVDFTASVIGGGFQWLGVKGADRCTLCLESAKFATLWDEEASWPNKLRMDGSDYQRLESRAPLDALSRLRWLRLQDYQKFVPQPYVQLAKVLQEMGHEVDARKILIAKQEDPARIRGMTIGRRIVHCVLGSTIGYGYRPWKAVWWIGSFILLGTCLFEYGFRIQQFQQEGSGVVPAFNAIMYSVDTFVPLVDFHQAKYQLPVLWWLRYYHWFHIFVGWVLTSLFVVGLTGLVRK